VAGRRRRQDLDGEVIGVVQESRERRLDQSIGTSVVQRVPSSELSMRSSSG
jgi:hypothetical protein